MGGDGGGESGIPSVHCRILGEVNGVVICAVVPPVPKNAIPANDPLMYA